jgi:hypothetical protein
MNRTKPENLAEHPVILAIHEKITNSEQRMDTIETNLAKNTALTSEIHDWLKVGKSGLQVLGWMGHFLGWVVSLSAGAAALYASYHNWLKK